jgi:hypothetical protein
MRAIVFLSHNGRTTWVLIPHDMASQLTVNQDQLNAAAHRALSHVNLTFADERGVEWREEAVFSAPTNFWVTFKLCPGGKNVRAIRFQLCWAVDFSGTFVCFLGPVLSDTTQHNAPL